MKIYYIIALGVAAVLFLWAVFQRKAMTKHFPFLKKRIGIPIETVELSDKTDMRGHLLVKTSDDQYIRPRPGLIDVYARFYKHLDGSVSQYKRPFEVIIDSDTVLTDNDYLIKDLNEFRIWKKYHVTTYPIVVAMVIFMGVCSLEGASIFA